MYCLSKHTEISLSLSFLSVWDGLWGGLSVLSSRIIIAYISALYGLIPLTQLFLLTYTWVQNNPGVIIGNGEGEREGGGREKENGNVVVETVELLPLLLQYYYYYRTVGYWRLKYCRIEYINITTRLLLLHYQSHCSLSICGVYIYRERLLLLHLSIYWD